ncbi:cell division protein ZapE [Vulcaniibacterium tengchongense]|uniref:Cell division protein ZapE n=1 Tax=Vulcaniibacterium tengchongense TaxID=1273429 RepID=A0A3N4VBL9_9GAMM|nr:cell division protein ZapE [Vulcaniibacterium tengchongense]RPE80008.1 cell division protein ZapE [Vulcaniibacterium tengchongense]
MSAPAPQPAPTPTPPSAAYAGGAARGEWQDDPAQHPALRELDRLHAALLDPPRPGLLDRLRGRKPPAPRGLYLWGGVGRGKTFLIDLFYDTLPFEDVAAEGHAGAVPPPGGEAGDRSRLPAAPARGAAPRKQRTHFHRFMREVHAQLRAHAGERDPLATIAHDWGRRLRVLVLDEFYVVDIGDAMLLGRLLERLFAEGVALVTTSNTEPKHLYKDGLQRERFLPAIAQIEAHCKVLHLDSAHDYRLRALTRSPVYRAPLDAQSDAWLAERWRELAAACPREAGPLRIDGRAIPVRALAEGHAWFDFAALCEGPRAASDYIEIATEYHTVLVGGVPLFDGRNDDAARRFVHLVDEFYDRHVNLVCTAAAAPPALYVGGRLAALFERTASRLVEMQSAEYLALEHRG